jgi:hypothetical protein
MTNKAGIEELEQDEAAASCGFFISQAVVIQNFLARGQRNQNSSSPYAAKGARNPRSRGNSMQLSQRGRVHT